jgi:nucleoside-diphosphate-sugar epimerase
MGRARVLVTGMSGLIGRAVGARLAERYALSALNRSPVEGVPCHRADIADLAAIEPVFAGVEAVVHLAAVASGSAPWEAILPSNVVGTYNVFEAARRAGVRRVVYASSGATIAGVEREMPYAALVAGRYDEVPEWPVIPPEAPPRPAGLYGASKVWGEALARHYADAQGMSMLCLRFGFVNAEDRPLAPRHFAVWCSQRDAVQAIARALDAPPALRFGVFHVVSDNRRGYRDLAATRRALGYAPEDRAEDHRGGPLDRST